MPASGEIDRRGFLHRDGSSQRLERVLPKSGAVDGSDLGKAVSDDGIVYFLDQQPGYGWPNKDSATPVPLRPVEAAQLLSKHYDVDAHLVQYAPPRRPDGYSCRLALAKFKDEDFRQTGPIAMRLAAFDVDDPVAHKAKIHARNEWRDEEWLKIEALREHHPELVVYATRGGYRIVGRLPPGLVVLNAPIAVARWKIFYEVCLRYLKAEFGITADDTKDASRLFRLPYVMRDGVAQSPAFLVGDASLSVPWSVPEYVFETTEKEVLEAQRSAPSASREAAQRSMASAASVSSDAPASDECVARARAYVAKMPPAIQGEHGSDALFNAALKCHGFGLNAAQIVEVLSGEFNQRCVPPWTAEELEHKAQGAADSGKPRGFMLDTPDELQQFLARVSGGAFVANAMAHPAAQGDSPWDFAGTEQGDAALFAAKHSGTIRYVEAWNKYIGWDGKRWTLEGGERLARTAWRDNLRDMLRDAAKETDDDRVKKLTEYARKRMTSAAEESTIKLAKAILHVSHKQLDADPYLLNLENGILDLRTMQLGPHDPAKLCTRLAPVRWEPGAMCPAWLSFLNWAMCGRQDLIDYLQRFFGLCLSGDSSHEKLHVFFGDGSNGKTTVIMVAEGMLGDYAARAPSKLLMKARHEAHPTEIADFAGCRMVTLAETEEDQQIDEQILKLIASKDPMKARRMREDFWEFEPTHKSILLTNHKPRVLGQDRGAWRRLVLVPWEATIEDERKDTQLPNRLVATELSGILQWAAHGWWAVHTNGLRPPQPVEAATAEYRADEDAVARFLEAECERGDTFSVQARPLCEAFNAWARSGRSGLLSERAVAKRMTVLGFEKQVRSDAAYWMGVRLRAAIPWTPSGPVVAPAPVKI
ncbi:MAG TPA: phage/plasmid primase, P4 family [Pirellulales bacterium]|nr:phage/plasmid primase, P4 family [Pirellulales bacterium]